jgi:hypothetical protein
MFDLADSGRANKARFPPARRAAQNIRRRGPFPNVARFPRPLDSRLRGNDEAEPTHPTCHASRNWIPASAGMTKRRPICKP